MKMERSDLRYLLEILLKTIGGELDKGLEKGALGGKKVMKGNFCVSVLRN